MSPPNGSTNEPVGSKWHKKALSSNRLSASLMPARFRSTEDDEEDFTAPPRRDGGRGGRFQYMHQSVFSMLAAAGSNNDFCPPFDSSYSDGEETEEPPRPYVRSSGDSGYLGGDAATSREDDGANRRSRRKEPKSDAERGRETHRRLSEHKLMQPFQKLALRSPKRKGKEREEASSSSSNLRAQPEAEGVTRPSTADTTKATAEGKAPVLSRMIEAKAQYDSSASASTSPVRQSRSRPATERTDSSATTLLSTRLMEIFGFEKPEKVVSEHQCCLVQSILLQGYMYVTEKHVCFYAYLPKKGDSVIKSGYLSKRGRQNPKYSRYWFTLKGNVLSYYLDPSNLYFPSGHVDLRYAISADLADHKGKEKDVRDFVITTDTRTYQLRADSAMSAKEWVKALQKVIFRSHNDGDSVKISLPVENVIDIEESHVLGFAETLKVRVVEDDDSYAIDEYFFSFFEHEKQAVRSLKDLVNDTTAHRITRDILATDSDRHRSRRRLSRIRRRSVDVVHPGREDGRSPASFQEPVKATLRPQSRQSSHGRPRGGSLGASGTDERRSSGGHVRQYSRASFSRDQSRSKRTPSPEKAEGEKSPISRLRSPSGSFVQSLEQGTESSALLQSTSDTESASQILNRSDVFRSPTIHTLQQSPSDPDDISRRCSGDTTGVRPTPAELHVIPPSRTQTGAFDTEHQQDERPDAGTDSQIGPHTHRPTHSISSPALQELAKASGYPFQRAAGLAGYLKDRSKRMSSLLASESMGYIEKVSGMWAGGRKHYGDFEGEINTDQMVDPEDEEQGCGYGDRFRAHFALPTTEKLQATYYCHLHRVLPLYGKIYISNRKCCFRSLLPGTHTKMILPLKDIENVEKEKGFRFGYHGLVIIISGHEELFFEFHSVDARDDCAVTLHQGLESIRYLVESGLLAEREKEEAEVAKAEHQMLQEARREGQDDSSASPSSSPYLSPDSTPILFDDPRASIVDFKPPESLRVTCLTIGSRGDVQPYITLCKGLIAEGHKAKIATHREFESWIRSHGVDFAPVEGDPAELMRICVENGMFTYSFLREASSKFRGWIDELLSSAWASCQDCDILIESPSAMAGLHIAEALGIPYFRAFTMPWTRTRAYPHAFAVPEHRMGGAYNYITYVMFDNVFWKAIAGQVNRWRKRELGLPSTNLDKMAPSKVPFLYNFSPLVVPPPLDYSDWIRVTGYWFLDEGQDWIPSPELADFIDRARKDGKKIVYIGFGSIVVSDPAALTKTVVESVLKADVRCILSKGWSDRLGDPASTKPEIPLPPEIYQITAAPHDWLFSQIDAVAHHGGAGTTGASLRAGVPTIIKPFFGDQFFFGNRVEDLGVGICLKRLNVSAFSRALWEATHSERMIVKAKVLGDGIRKEDGVANAIQAIYRDLEYARTLVKQRQFKDLSTALDSGSPDQNIEEDLDPIEESWTFVGDEVEKSNSRERIYDL